VVGQVEPAIRQVFEGREDGQRALILKAEGVRYPTTRRVRELQARVEPALGVDLRRVVLGHVVRGGHPSYRDRMIASRLGHMAVSCLREGLTDVMLAWRPHRVDGFQPLPDPSIRAVPLARMLTETAKLLDGSSPVTQRRVRMMESVEGVMSL